MSKTVDERVVSMQFDNQQFEKNVKTSIDTINKLNKKFHNKYKIVNNKIYEIIDVPYYDAIIGSEIEITLPDKSSKKIFLPKGTQQDDMYAVTSNYKIIVNVTTPKKPSNKEIELLKQLK